MNIIVCAKQVPNPDIPPSKFKIDSKAKRVVPPEGVPPVINPFDEQAVEAALRIKEKHGAHITIVSMGSESARDVVKHALSMGGDEGVMLQDEAFEGSDSFATAHILTKAIEKIGKYDLILCGRQAADWDAGQVGSIIAENLGIPVITLAKKIEVIDSSVKVVRVIPDGYEVIEIPLPVLITVSNEIGQARLPTGRGIILSMKKQIPIWHARDLNCDNSLIGKSAARSELLDLSVPSRERKGEIIGGENVAEAAGKLALRLREAKII